MKTILVLTVAMMVILPVVGLQRVLAVTDTQLLGYGDFTHISSTEEITSDWQIAWSFTGSNSEVGITVRAMSEESFLSWLEIGGDVGDQLSDGSKYSDSGTYKPKQEGIWYIVFQHNDGEHREETTVTMEVNFELQKSSFPWWLILLIILLSIIIGAGIIVSIVIVIGRVKAEEEYYSPPPPDDYEPEEITVQKTVDRPPVIPVEPKVPPQKPKPKHPEKQIICPKCGQPNPASNTFCSKCGAKL